MSPEKPPINEIRTKILELEEKHDIKLSTMQKTLFSIEGQIVTILDTLYGDVKLFIIDQKIIKADEDIAEKLDINEGEEVDLREVLIHKHGRPLIYGFSYIPKDRCSDTVIEKLLKEKSTTGRIILEHKIESRTEVINISIEKPSLTLQGLFNTTEDMLSREYILIHKKKIVIWSKEIFPISYFKDWVI